MVGISPIAWAQKRLQIGSSGHWLLLAVLLASVLGGLLAPPPLLSLVSRNEGLFAFALMVLSVGALLVFAMSFKRVRAAWHRFANSFGVAPPEIVASPWVVDGDTIDDLATGVRYRLANIDSPETGDNARCHRERTRGGEAKWMAIRFVRAASRIEVRKTWRVDRYGRRVAFVLIDGRDLGVLLVELGLALPWRGCRETWCGSSGGLAEIARTGARPHTCATCHCR